MNTEKFENALNNVEDKYIEEAATYKKSNTALKVWRAIAIAACVCLVAGGVFIAAQSGSSYSRKLSESNSYEYGYDMMRTEAKESPAAMYDYGAYADEDAVYEEPMEMETAAAADFGSAILGTTSSNGSLTEQRENAKIIYTAYMDMQSTEFDKAAAGIEALVSELGGYFEYQDMSNNNGRYRYAYYTVRIPVENFDALLSRSGDIGTVTSLSKNAMDISDSYYDTDSRLTTAKTKLARLQELLSEAENMEDIITLETAISDTEWEIDNLSGTIRNYDSQISYSTVSISLNEVYKVETDIAPLSFGEKISNAFSDGMEAFGDFCEGFVIFLANAWIWLVIIAIIVVVIVLIVKSAKKRRNK